MGGQSQDNFKLDERFLASLVGIAALALPFGLIWASAKDSTSWRGACEFSSISHYYYSAFQGSIFVGMMAFVSAFLIAYRGEHWRENLITFIAGLCAAVVAFIPTSGPGCDENNPFLARPFVMMKVDNGTPSIIQWEPTETDRYFQLTDWAQKVHLGNAALLFSLMALFIFWVFVPAKSPQHYKNGKESDGLKLTKKIRNFIYVLCILAIVLSGVCLLGVSRGFWAYPEFLGDYPVFWLEAIMLWAFGSAWLTRGRVFFDFWGRPLSPLFNWIASTIGLGQEDTG